MSARQKDLLRQVEYPESDGHPMGETDTHRQLMVDLIEALKTYFTAEIDVYVSGNLMCYYVEGDGSKSISPDVFVVRGVAKHERRVYKFWEEPAPIVVLEISSRKTRKEDFGKKKDLYAWLGVREYFVFDPEAKLRAPLRAFRLHLRTQEYLPTPTENYLRAEQEAARAQREAVRAQQESAHADQESARADRLATKLRELGLDPDQL